MLGPLQIPGAIVFNFALNGYSTLDELAYFGHKYFEYFCAAKIIQALNCSGANYSDKVIKILYGLFWGASCIKRLNQPLIIDTILARDEAYEWYFKAIVEVEKIKKEFGIASHGVFFTLSGISGTN